MDQEDGEPSLDEILHGVNIVFVVACFVGFAPAIVHARDGIDRLYLMGGAILLAGVALSSFVHYHAPITVATPLFILGELTWAFSAVQSRRRRAREQGQREEVRRVR